MGPYDRIRVAILDTGYDRGSIFFRNRSRRSRIKGWKDLVDGLPEAEDTDGHGTHVVSLVMKMAPAADIYVARVAKNTDGLQDASKNAISWATDNCKTDIISMSFGFPDEVLVDDEPVISKAIRKAMLDRDDAVLFFAAAANLGAQEKEMFPANHDLVISIRGTNVQGTFEDFNPPPDRDGPSVFGILGKVVPSAGLCSQDEVCKSGTSVATPIAAGIAAMLLGYADLGCHKGKLQPGHRRKLRTRRGMEAMFRAISTWMAEKLLYVNPQKFFQNGEPVQWLIMISAADDARGARAPN
ncbi:hypothetical protein LTR28_003759 [Elasticomyces elasticus]|nr:hypothetical protein LTR28_003759 [Elasticomyces elasticus]